MKRLTIGLLFVVLSLDVFASIESEIEAKRFQRQGDVLIDTWSGLNWQDNKDVGKLKKSRNPSIDYCASLNLHNRNDWRLPNINELYQIAYPIEKANLFKYTSPADDDGDIYYRSSNYKRKGTWICSSKTLNMKDRRIIGVFSCWNHGSFRCVSGNKLTNNQEILDKIKQTRKQLEYNLYLKLVKSKNTIKDYENLVENYPNVSNVNIAKINLHKLYNNKFNKDNELALKNNKIKLFVKLIKNNPNASEKKLQDAKTNIFKLVKSNNNISGYQWFIKNYPSAKEINESIENIHKLAYQKAKEINTISSYNTFIYSYPYSSQVKQANDKAYKMEIKKYTDLGLLGFFGKEEKMERKARKLLIKAKQIERISTDYRGDAKAGYFIVANRMYDLLQQKFDDSDATLRHLESQEFKDFVKSFKSIMSGIKYTLNKINSNVSNIGKYAKQMIEVAKDGFANANADRDMASYKLEQHEKWEKFMHFRDKGYK